MRFIGKEENKADERVQLTCTIKVKEIGTFGFWSKRFCVLCGSQLHIFSSSQPKGKPSLTLDLAGGKITEQENKKHFYCLQIVTAKKTVLLSFDSRYDQSVWLKRAAKVHAYFLHIVTFFFSFPPSLPFPPPPLSLGCYKASVRSQSFTMQSKQNSKISFSQQRPCCSQLVT